MKQTHLLVKIMVALTAVIMCLVPFHAFLTVWLASMVGHYTGLRLWKELLLGILVVLSVPLIFMKRFRTTGRWRSLLGGQALFVVAKLYALICVLSGLVAYVTGGVSLTAFGYGLIVDLRFLAFFGVVWVVASRSDWLHAHWKRLIIVPASIVVIFGIAQFQFLPDTFLTHFGYGPDTINALQTIDQKAGYHRIQSTLRGANPLGAYLVVVLSVLGGLILWHSRRRAVWIVLFGLSMAALCMTFSRSAWIGAVVALGWLLFWAIRAVRLRRILLVAAAALMIVFAGVGYMLRDNDVFQNTFFHTDETSQSAKSSNSGHVSASLDGLKDIVTHPLGSGTGTAGPASVYNGTVRIAENYYIQIGQESGLIGLALFVLLVVMIGRALWLRRDQTLPAVLLASLVGISVIGLLSHVWTDDTLAYVWWGMAGIALALPVNGNPESFKDWYMRHTFLKQLSQYFFGGGLYFISGLAIFSLCYSYFKFPWWAAKIAGDVVGFSLNYVVQRYYAFARDDLRHHEAKNRSKYIAFSVFNIALDYAIVGGLKHVGITPYIGIFVSAGFFTIWNYLGYKYWVFRRPKPTGV